MIINLLNPLQFHEQISTGNLVLVDFYADWCEPCKWLDAILEEVNQQLSIPMTILKVDTDQHPDLVGEFNLKSVPVLIVFKDGKQVWRLNGFLAVDELIEKMTSISRETN